MPSNEIELFKSQLVNIQRSFILDFCFFFKCFGDQFIIQAKKMLNYFFIFQINLHL